MPSEYRIVMTKIDLYNFPELRGVSAFVTRTLDNCRKVMSRLSYMGYCTKPLESSLEVWKEGNGSIWKLEHGVIDHGVEKVRETMNKTELQIVQVVVNHSLQFLHNACSSLYQILVYNSKGEKGKWRGVCRQHANRRTAIPLPAKSNRNIHLEQAFVPLVPQQVQHEVLQVTVPPA